MLASKSVARVYAAWEVLSIALTPESTNVDAAGGTYSFAVAANGSWSAQSDSDWVSVLEGKGTGDSSVRFSVGANAATQGRSATIHVALSDGVTVRDFTIRQSAMSSLATPVISPADGTMFSGSTRRVAISCATADATIRYTLDGSEPDETSILYKDKSFNVFDTTVVKAKAWLDSLGVVGAGGSTESVAKSDTDGDGFTAAEEYVMGTDPNDPESRLTALIEFVDGKPVITYTPNLLDDRKYIKWGKKDLGDPTEEWAPVPEGREGDYNFFKISVEMP